MQFLGAAAGGSISPAVLTSASRLGLVLPAVEKTQPHISAHIHLSIQTFL